MPRGGKRGGKRGNSHRGNPRGRGLGSNFVHSSGTSTPRKGFTLADEARNTEELHQSWTPDRQLRYNKVNFVSAGALPNPNEIEAESAMAQMNLDSPPRNPKDAQNGEQRVHVQVEVDVEEEDRSRPTDTLDFVIDTHGDKSMSTNLPPPRIGSPSPTPSNSSEEVILFGGRDNKGNGVLRSARGSERATSTNSFDARIKLVEDRIHIQEELLEETFHEGQLEDNPRGNSKSPPFCEELMRKPSPPCDLSDGYEPVVSGRRNRRVGSRRKQKAAEQEAILEDYLANMDSEDKELLASASGFNARELGGTDDDAWQETEMSSGEPQPSKSQLKNGWNSDIEDLDDLSTSDGVMGEVQGIFSKRERPNGSQYLVVWENQTMDDARWVPETTLTSVRAQAHIEAFETEERLVARFAAASEDGSGDDSTDEGDTTDEDAEDEVDLLQRKIERMGDEQIARLLAKQEELGMGSNELLLFDDAADADEEDGFALPRRSFNPFMLPQKKTRSKRPKGEFPAAAALADAYDGFDVMDFERPSLKKKPKGRKGKLILDDVNDSELEESMQAAWDNDRIKKKERKKEREEVRARGLLGIKNGKPDLKQKYKEGMGMKAIKEEIKNFLTGNHTTLALPPMDKADRKIVHEIANAFKLKSKSVGNGNSRAPVLIRTARTLAFMERTWAQVDSQTSRGFLPRIDLQAHRGGKKLARAGGGGFNNAAVGYRDGDVVGASAAALGAENRGRAMLEKMGWSHGTALGALDNKGILEPVSHVVKTTRAGLG